MTDNKKGNEIIDYLKSLVSDEVQKVSLELKEEDAKKIITAIMPDMDNLISERVKEHFIEIADFIKEKFTDVSEEK